MPYDKHDDDLHEVRGHITRHKTELETHLSKLHDRVTSVERLTDEMHEINLSLKDFAGTIKQLHQLNEFTQKNIADLRIEFDVKLANSEKLSNFKIDVEKAKNEAMQATIDGITKDRATWQKQFIFLLITIILQLGSTIGSIFLILYKLK